MLHVYLASALGLAPSPAASEQPTDTPSARVTAIEARVATLTQRNDAMAAGKTAANAMRAPDLSRSDRYHLGNLAFEAYFVAHLNQANIEALCAARRVARAMKQVAATPEQRAGARGLVGQVDAELARMQPPGTCEASRAPPAKAPPALMAVRPAPAVEVERPAPALPGPSAPPPAPGGHAGAAGRLVDAGPGAARGANAGEPPAEIDTLERPVVTEDTSPARPRPTFSLPTTATPAPASPDSPPRWTPRAWAGLGTMIVGTGLLAGMGASLRARQLANDRILALDRQIEAENRNPTVDESLRAQQANLRWQGFTTAAVVTGSVGAVALITGTVLLATGLRPRHVRVSPWGSATSAGLMLGGTF